MVRLPTPGSDEGTWGDLLNEFLAASHDVDGTIKPDAVNSSTIQDDSVSGVKLQDDSVTNAKLDSGAGIDGQVLMKDSLTSGGFKWASTSGTPPATASGLGTVQLAGDLGGTAASPTVPQLANKQPLDSDLTSIASLVPTDNDLLQRKAGTWTNRTPTQVKTDLGLVIGTDVEAHDTDLTAIAGLSPSDNDVLQRKAGAWTNRTPGQVKADLSLTKSDVGLNNVTNNAQYYAGGTDVAIADGGTNASTASGARTNLGLVIGTDVEAHDVDLTTIASLSPADNDVLQRKAGVWANRTMSQVKTDLVLVKGDVGLGNVDNTSDIAKPISSDTQAALNGKEGVMVGGTTLQYLRGDKTFQTLDKAAVGLSNVDNTSDSAKPISTAMQTALDGKENTVASGTVFEYYRGDKTFQVLDKAAVGLANVNNTSDAAKPISSDTQTALSGKENTIIAGTTAQYYRGDKTFQVLDKIAVGLANVDNTSDVTKNGATVTLTNKTISGASNTITAIAQSSVTNLVTDLAAKAPLAAPALTGNTTAQRLTISQAQVNTPVVLTDAATIATDASLGNHFRVTLGGNRTLGAPTNPTDGQKITYEIIQDGTGSRTLAYDAVFAFGTDITSPALTTTINKRDFLGFIYNSTAGKWFCLAVAKGY